MADAPGTLKIIDGVEHVMGPDGNYTPSNPGESMKKNVIGAGKSLWNAISGEAAAAPAEKPPEGYINKRIGKPF